MNPRIQELFDIIKRAQDELEEIRSTCSHPAFHKGLWSWDRPGNVVVAKICSECNDYLESVNEDIKDYYVPVPKKEQV